jgi:hypothetical protein
LQALTLLNDQQFYEFAEALAQRALSLPTKEETARLEYAFRVCLGRAPNQAESQRLKELFAQQFQQEQGNEIVRRAEAWKTVARVLLNLDETITRE